MELDKPVQEWLEMMTLMGSEGRVLSVDDMASVRQAMGLLGEFVATPPEVARTHDYLIARTNGEIGARVYWPAGEGPHPIHVNFHGGGFVMGSAFEGASDSMMRARCVGSESIVVSVDYRLAPEHRFPVGVEDCYAGLVWAVNNAAALNGDGSRVTVGGVSAGGVATAVVALMARERGGPPLRLQLLEAASTDLTTSSHSWRNPKYGHDMERGAHVAMHISLYFRHPRDIVHPYASPLMAPELDGVAPAYIMSGEHDPRRDECEAYAARLADAGVKAVVSNMLGHVHGSNLLTKAWEGARQWQDEANAVIRHANYATPSDIFTDFSVPTPSGG
jgi:acetyl esterase